MTGWLEKIAEVKKKLYLCALLSGSLYLGYIATASACNCFREKNVLEFPEIIQKFHAVSAVLYNVFCICL